MRLACTRRAAVATILVGWAAITCSCSTPDAEMIKNLRQHQAEFDELRLMFLEDAGLTRVDFDFTWPAHTESVGVSDERLVQYRGLFTALDLSHGIGVDPWDGKDTIWFFASASGPQGGYKHYVYTTRKPEVTVDNLNDASAQRHPYRHIHGNWYLRLEVD